MEAIPALCNRALRHRRKAEYGTALKVLNSALTIIYQEDDDAFGAGEVAQLARAKVRLNMASLLSQMGKHERSLQEAQWGTAEVRRWLNQVKRSVGELEHRPHCAEHEQNKLETQHERQTSFFKGV